MRAGSEDGGARGGGRGGERGRDGGKDRGRKPASPVMNDFAGEPAYQAAVKLYGITFDLEMKFPDDERETLYLGLKKASTEVGAFLAAGFGRGTGPSRVDLWSQARSRLMEARHYVLLAESRYMLDTLDVEAFDTIYAELLIRIDALLAEKVATP